MNSIHSPLPGTLGDECKKAASIISKFSKPEDSTLTKLTSGKIPLNIIQEAKGIAILTVIKAGLIWSGRAGSGLVIARTDSGWSSPSAIATAGFGIGWQVGAEITDFVIILNTKEAVDSFMTSNVTLGGNMSIAAGFDGFKYRCLFT